MTKKILVTGGTVFVSKFVATYFKNHDYDVYVLNRGNRKQIEGVKLIKGDRHHLGYLYGPMQNVYREPFVFECALKKRSFYLPNDGKMLLQFFHVEDLCKLMETIIKKHPHDHIMNVGNSEIVDINKFVELCYQVVGVPLNKVYVTKHDNQRDYFSFHNYNYVLDVTKQNQLLPSQKSLFEGLEESYQWYLDHPDEVVKKNYIEFIDQELI